MFNNIGGKIKALAAVITWIGIIASFIAGFAVFKDNVLLAILIIIIGSVISWVSAFVLYGFGHLIVKVDELADDCHRISLNENSNDSSYKPIDLERKNYVKDSYKEELYCNYSEDKKVEKVEKADINDDFIKDAISKAKNNVR